MARQHRSLRHCQRELTIAMFITALGLLSCEGVPRKDKKNRSTAVKAVASQTENPSTTNDSSTPAQVEVISLEQDIVASLHTDLLSAGLTTSQADVITASASQQVSASVGTIAIGGSGVQLYLAASAQPASLLIVNPAIIEGAMKALDDPAAGLDTAARRSAITEVIMHSTFKSLKGRTDTLPDAELVTLTQTMVQQAVKTLNEAGLGGEHSAEGAQAVTLGAMGALELGGITAGVLPSVATSLVNGAVEGLASLDLGPNTQGRPLITQAVGKAAEGAVAGLGLLSLAREASLSLLGELTSAAINSSDTLNKTLSINPIDFKDAGKEIARGSVASLKKAGMSGDDDFEPAMEQISRSLVAGLDRLGLSKDEQGGGVAAIVSGSVAGAGTSGFSEAELTAKGFIGMVVGANIKNLQASGLTPLERANAVAGMVNGALSALSTAGISTTVYKEAAYTQALQRAVGSFSHAGLSDQASQVFAIERLARGASGAMPAAGIASGDASHMSGLIITTSLRSMVDEELSTTVGALTQAAAGVAKGATEGLSSLAAQQFISSAAVRDGAASIVGSGIEALVAIKAQGTLSIATADLGAVATEMSSQTLLGLALGGSTSAEIASANVSVASRLVDDLRVQGVSEAQLTYAGSLVDSAATSAMDLADSLSAANTGFAACLEQYSDALSDSSFFSLLPSTRQEAVYCRSAAKESCPKERENVSFKTQWLYSGIEIASTSTPYLCALRYEEKSIDLPGSFTITDSHSVSTQLNLSWSAASATTYYVVTIASDSACYVVQDQQRINNINTTTYTTPSLNEGTYYVCVSAFNSIDKATVATNNALPVIHDFTAPTAPSLTINAGASYTISLNVTLGISAVGATDMYISNSGCSTGGSWQGYATSKAWVLPSLNSSNTVSIKFRDDAGNETACQSDSIIHDSQVPTLSIESAAASTALSSVSLGFSAVGMAEMYITNTAGCGSGGTWESYATSKTGWTLGQSNATATVYAKFRDAASNESTCVSDTIAHDGQAPAGASISIAGAAAYTGSSTVALTLAATDASSVSMYITNTAGCGSGGDWESYATSKTGWTLGQSNSLATVYVKFKDILGNETSCLSDTITHDTQGPAAPSSFNDGASTASLSTTPLLTWTAAIDSGSGVAYYELALGTSSASTDVLPWVSIGSALEFTKTGLSLTAGQTYYASIRAVDVLGNAGAIASGDGFSYKIWKQQAYIKAANSTSGLRLGTGLALFNDLLAVGAAGDKSNQTTITDGTYASTDQTNTGSGAAYVYKRNGTNWQQQAYIKASNNDSLDNFGISTAISGTLLAVGAYNEGSNETTITNGATASADNSLAGSGAVYIYKKSGVPSWSQQAYIKPANAAASSQFGELVALSATTLAVSALGDDSNATTITNDTTASANTLKSGSGAVYIYRQTGVNWAQEAYIKSANSLAGNEFGRSLTLYGNTLVVGTIDKSAQTTISNGTSVASDAGSVGSGAAFVYVRNAATWSQEAYIKAANNDPAAGFGKSSALSGDTLAVSAPWDDSSDTTITNGTLASADQASEDSGAVYIYKRAATTWAQEAYIKAANNYAEDRYGMKIHLHGDTLAVAAAKSDSDGTTISNGTTASINFTSADSGSVYVYQRSASHWQQEAFIKAANSVDNLEFGSNVAVYGNTIAVSATGEESNETSITNGTTASTNTDESNAGAVYIYIKE